MSKISLKFSKCVFVWILFQVFDDFFIWRPFVIPHNLLDLTIPVFCNLGTREFSHSFGHVERWVCVILAQSFHATSLAIDNLNPNRQKFPIHINSFDCVFGKFITLLLNIPRHPVHFPIITASGQSYEAPIHLNIVENLKVNPAFSSLERKWKIVSFVYQKLGMRYLFDHLRGCKWIRKLFEVVNIEE